MKCASREIEIVEPTYIVSCEEFCQCIRWLHLLQGPDQSRLKASGISLAANDALDHAGITDGLKLM